MQGCKSRWELLDQPVRNLAESLSWWLKDNWKVLALLLGLSAATIAYGAWVTRNAGLPAVPDQGTVVRFATYFAEKSPQPVVIVRLRDGRTVQLRVAVSTLVRCRVGSPIRLIWHGEILEVAPSGCPPRAS